MNELRKWLGVERKPIGGFFFFCFSSREAHLFLLIILAFKRFEDWNAYPEIPNAARRLYGDIDRLELYPGLHAEGHAEDGFGQKYDNVCILTVLNGLLFDAIALVWPFALFHAVILSNKNNYRCRSVEIQVLPLNSLVELLFPHFCFYCRFTVIIFFYGFTAENVTPWGYSDVARDYRNKSFGGHSKFFFLLESNDPLCCQNLHTI